jgi:peroxiredoxin
MTAEVGEKAPEFTLPADNWESTVSLESVRREGPVALFFYPGDWSSVCSDQMSELEAEKERFEEVGAKVLGVSADSPWSHRAFAEDRGISFPLLSDLKREVLPQYGVEHEKGFPERAYFVIDREGVIRAKKVEASPKERPGIEEVLEAVKKAF